MDPNACLEEILSLCAGDDPDALRLIELMEALDGWIIKGGFLPDRWVAHDKD